jgi:protein gp37
MGKIIGRYQSDNWNPWEGCRKCSEACKHCFLFPRLFGRDMDGARRCKTTWDKPWGWQKAAVAASGRKTVGLCFCSDFLIEEADPWRQEAWATIRDTPNLTWMFCSKRTKRLADCLPSDWGKGYPNVAIGASFENKKHFDRIGYIQAVPAAFRFLDICPCLGNPAPELADHLDGIGLVIVSGERSTPDFRPLDLKWARDVRDLCAERGIAFRFGHGAGRDRHPSNLLDGKTYPGEVEFLKEVGM